MQPHPTEAECIATCGLWPCNEHGHRIPVAHPFVATGSVQSCVVRFAARPATAVDPAAQSKSRHRVRREARRLPPCSGTPRGHVRTARRASPTLAGRGLQVGVHEGRHPQRRREWRSGDCCVFGRCCCAGMQRTEYVWTFLGKILSGSGCSHTLLPLSAGCGTPENVVGEDGLRD